MRLQAGTLITPSEKLWSKVVKGQCPQSFQGSKAKHWNRDSA